MKGALDLSLVIGLVVLPFRAVHRGPRFLAAGAVVLALAFYFYIAFVSPRLA